MSRRPAKTPCFCCRPDCYECNPELWMAAVNADFAANADRYQKEYEEAEAVPLSPEQLDRMMTRVRELIAEDEDARIVRGRIAGNN